MWFREHKSITAGILAASVIIVLFSLFLKRRESSSGVKGGLQSAASFVAEPIAKASNGVRKGLSGIFRFKEIVAENQRLTEEIDSLKQENARLVLKKEEKKELEELYQVFHYQAAETGNVQAADLISMDYSNWQDVFTINRGSKNGIHTGATVISGDGLVGKVTEVSGDTAKVTTILADDSKISFGTSGEKSRTGVLKSDGKGGLTGYLLEGGKDLKKGDILRTSGIGLYAKGLKIGTVTEVEKKKGTQRISIKADPSVHFIRLRKVVVLL